MAYQPTVWAENDLISIDRMNKIEQGLMAAADTAEQQHAMLELKIDDSIAEVRANTVPVTRTINGKALDADINLTASNVGARSSSWVPSPAQVGAIPADPVAAMSVLTQTEYDALTTKDAATLYLIKEGA